MEFLEKFTSLHDGMTFQNLHFDPKNFVLAVMLAWVGVAIAFIASYYITHVLGGFVEKIVAYNATSPEDAETLGTLGVGKGALVRLSLRERSAFRRTVLAVGGEDGKKVPLDALRFYIPKERLDEARFRYRKKGIGSSLPMLILCLVISAAVALAAILWGPDLMQLIDNLITQVKG